MVHIASQLAGAVLAIGWAGAPKRGLRWHLGTGYTRFTGANKAECLAALSAGGLVVGFPESKQHQSPLVCTGQGDLVALAWQAKAPIFPACYLTDPNEPALVSRIAGPKLVIGAKLDFDRYYELDPVSNGIDGYLLRTMTDQLMLAIAELGQRRYVDHPVSELNSYSRVIGDQEKPSLWQWLQDNRAKRRAAKAEQQAKAAAEAELAAELAAADEAEMAAAAKAAAEYVAQLEANNRDK